VPPESPRERSREIAAFADGDAQVLCAGIQALRLGWNLDMARAAIVCGLPWSHEALDQAVARVHRLTSQKPVEVYVVLAKGTLDARKWELLCEKAAAADLALDGRLVEEDEEPIDWQKVLEQMRRAGVRAAGDEVPEADVEAVWRRAEGALAPLAHGLSAPPSAASRVHARAPVPKRAVPPVELTEEASGQLCLVI